MAIDKTRVAADLATGGMAENYYLTKDLMNKAAGDTPQLGTAEIDPGTSELIKQQTARANQSPEEIANQQMQGVGEQSKFIHGMELPSFANTAQGDVDAALKSRANRQFQEGTIRAKEQAYKGAQGYQANRLAQAFQQQQGVDNVQRQAFNIARGNQIQKIAARYQVLGSLIGIGGTIGGAAIGGPMGAAAGNKITQPTQTQQPTANPYGTGQTQTASRYDSGSMA